MTVTKEQVLSALRAVQDPDLHKAIVSLGFVKDVRIEAGEVDFTIELTTPASPGVFRPGGQEDAYQCVIMPMNLNR